MKRRKGMVHTLALWGAVLLSTRWAFAEIAITTPSERAVVQRDAAGGATIEVRGTVDDGSLELLELRAVRIEQADGLATAWEPVSLAKLGFVHTLRLEGGWYRLEVRSHDEQGATSTATVERVGVGEVFVTAGQSNSANSGSVPLTPQDDRVSAWGPDGWQLAEDPQPIATGGGGTPWPVLGDLLVAELGVPVGFVSVGWGGTRVAQWLPGGTLYPRLRDALGMFGVHGVRAVLWHQGESDNSEGTSSEDYVARLEAVIEASRRDAGYDVAWGVAIVSYLGQTANRITEAQTRVIAADPLVFEGPTTDDLLGEEWRSDGVHFNEAGLREHARRWAERISADCCAPPEQPWAALSASSTFVAEGEELLLSAEGSFAEGGRTLVAWEWDFGDGATGSGVTAAHRYTAAGPYEVVLRVTDSDGNSRVAKAEVFVTVRPADVSPWASVSIGANGFGAGERVVEDCLVVAGGGGGVRGTTDQFRLLYQQVTGGFALTVRLSEVCFSGERASVLLALREDVSPGAKQLAIARTITNGELSLAVRVRSGRISRLEESMDGIAPEWLRVERVGASLRAHYSDDGLSWSELWRGTLELGDTVVAGVGVTSDDTTEEGLPTFATFCDVGFEERALRFLRGDCNGDGQVTGSVSDALFLLGHLFLDRREPDCLAACDADGDGAVVATLQDAFYLLNHSFGAGAPPPSPFPHCGAGHDDDALLTCEEPAVECRSSSLEGS